MHYVISYDLENDRLREKTVKVLRRHGAKRLQKSVFIAPDMPRRALKALQSDLQRLYKHAPLSPQNNLIILPLRKEQSPEVWSLGDNNIHTFLSAPPLKIIL